VTSKYLEEPEEKSPGFKPGGVCRLPKRKLILPSLSTVSAFDPV